MTEKKTATKKAATKKAAVKKSEVDSDSSDDIIAIIQEKKEILVYMKNGQSFSSGDLEFTKERPFKLMDQNAADLLVELMPEKFEYATKEQVEKFYSIG